MVARKVIEIAEAADIETAWQRHLAVMKGYGIDTVMYGSTLYRSDRSMGDPEEFMVLANSRREYLETFLQNRYYLSGSMVRWSLENVGAISWTDMHRRYSDGAMPEDERKVYEFNARHGLKAGYTIGFPTNSSRRRAAMALVMAGDVAQSEMDRLWSAEGEDILAICYMLNLRVQCLPYYGPRRRLTDRQREVLEWVGDGKSVQDIAALIGRTPATVEKHLRLAREALGAETTAQAVLKAAVENQIFVLDAREVSSR